MPTKIKVIAPASTALNMLEILIEASNQLIKNNIELIYRSDIFSNAELPFFSASHELRQQDLLDAILAPDYNIIWAARGGSGCSNLLEACLKQTPSKMKTIIGFSDITSLHVLFNQFYNLPTIHGPVISSFIRNKDDFDIFIPLLNSEKRIYNLALTNNIKVDSIEGDVQGGNLTVLTTLLGTKLHPYFKNKIILLEDIGEKGYQVYRHLMHLKQAGSLEGALAIIFGDFSNSDEQLTAAIDHFCQNQINIPSYKINNIGHENKNEPIILGARSILKGNQLTVYSPFNYSI